MNIKISRMVQIVIIILVTSISTLAGTIPRVNFNGDKIMLQQSPFVENGRTYVPLRSVSENLGATVWWESSTQTIIIKNDKTTVICQIGNSQAKVNDESVTLDVAPKIKLGTTYVPLRFTADCLGAKMTYDKATNTIGIEYEITQNPLKQYINGKAIRTTKLPSNSKDFAYILEGIPNEMYELKPVYAYKNNLVEGKNYTRPVNISRKAVYSEENVQKWKELVERNLGFKLNVNYKTIDNSWADGIAQTYMDSLKGEDGYYDRNFKDAKKYVQYVKDNKIVIEGDYFVEPSICYASSGAIYLRCWVKFQIKQSNIGKAELYEKSPSSLKSGKTYSGYVDFGLGTNTGNSRGDDLGIVKDTISETAGMKINN